MIEKIKKKLILKIAYLLNNLNCIATHNRGMSKKEIQQDKNLYNNLNQDTRFELYKKYEFLCKYDKYANNGNIDNDYFIQDIWGARKVFENQPSVHYDVGSSVAGFIAHLLGMKQKVILIDIRPISNTLNTKFLNKGGGYSIFKTMQQF